MRFSNIFLCIKGREVPMSSVSPTLTKMKDNGIIVRRGLKVR